MSGLQFKFSCLLTAMHYMVTTIGLELLRLGGAYEHRASPITPRLLMLVLLVGSAPAVNNLSLRYNNLGFYQVNKLLVTPCIVTMEWVCFGITVSRPRLAALLAIAAGVGVASVNDVSITMAGCLASCATLPLNAAYKALWSREQKQNGWTTLALMRRVLPLATLALLAMSPLIDPPGVSEFEWTPRSTGLIFLSCLSAFLVTPCPTRATSPHPHPSHRPNPNPNPNPSPSPSPSLNLPRALVLTAALALPRSTGAASS